MQVASMKSMMKKIVFVENYKKSIKYFFLIATLIFFVFCKKTEKPSTTYGFKGGDFSLHSYKGMFSLDQVRGKVVLIYFGFISCPDICPTTLATVARALKELDEEEVKNVQMLFIGVDTERDSLEKLERYTSFFRSQILPLTGTVSELQKVASLYGAVFMKEEITSGIGYTMDHTTRVFVGDTYGKFVDSIPYGATSFEISSKIRE